MNSIWELETKHKKILIFLQNTRKNTETFFKKKNFLCRKAINEIPKKSYLAKYFFCMKNKNFGLTHH